MGKARTELSAETGGNTKEAPTPALPGNIVYSVLEERVGISLQEAKEKKLPERGSGVGRPRGREEPAGRGDCLAEV